MAGIAIRLRLWLLVQVGRGRRLRIWVDGVQWARRRGVRPVRLRSRLAVSALVSCETHLASM
ncbi:hypothetical protein XF35_19615 [Streptomyces platensis subsp. clarensis]|nr:hypothetical protein [Streptomyces platensis subsp. clarensis]